MGPLSAVAVIVWVGLVCLTWINWITASAKVLGIVGLIACAAILLDTFWSWRTRQS